MTASSERLCLLIFDLDTMRLLGWKYSPLGQPPTGLMKRLHARGLYTTLFVAQGER